MAMTFRSIQMSPISEGERLGRTETPAVAISQVLFEGALLRERQRADRYDEPLLVLEVSAGDGVSVPQSDWDAVVSSVDAATRETDLLGWIRPLTTIGVILTDHRLATSTLSGQLEKRIRCQLGQRLDRATADSLSVRLHGYPEPDSKAPPASSEEILPLLPLLEDIGMRAAQPHTYEVVKRAFDIIGSVTLLAVLSPLLLLIAAAVKVGSSGPVFFKQVRIGLGGRSFTMFKFRTMRMNADSDIHQAYVSEFIKDTTGMGRSETTQVFKILNDPRVTRLGHMLRRTSLDELPQLWNVLRGDMSLVGPRPPASLRSGAVQVLAHSAGPRVRPRDHGPVAGYGAQPYNVRRNGETRPSIRADPVVVD